MSRIVCMCFWPRIYSVWSLWLELIKTPVKQHSIRQNCHNSIIRPLASYGLPPHPPTPPKGEFCFFFIAYYLASILQHVSPLAMGALPSNSLLHSLPLQKL